MKIPFRRAVQRSGATYGVGAITDGTYKISVHVMQGGDPPVAWERVVRIEIVGELSSAGKNQFIYIYKIIEYGI